MRVGVDRSVTTRNDPASDVAAWNASNVVSSRISSPPVVFMSLPAPSSSPTTPEGPPACRDHGTPGASPWHGGGPRGGGSKVPGLCPGPVPVAPRRYSEAHGAMTCGEYDPAR